MSQGLGAFKKAGNKLAAIFAKTIKHIDVGIPLEEIDRFADDLIKKTGGQANFKKVADYSWATCINLNDGIVHGVPDKKKVKKGDLVSLDMGLVIDDWNVDMAYTVQAGKIADLKRQKQVERFLSIGETALNQAIKAAKFGNRVGDISSKIEKTIESVGYQCSRELTGHGIGRSLHQFPWIPCVLTSPVERTPILKEGMGLAIEVIYTEGSPRLKKADDGWTITTQDGRISALFEKTILVTKSNAKVITPYTWGELIDFQ